MAVDGWLSDDDAQDILGAAERRREDGELDATDFPPELLARAGAAVLRILRRQAVQLECERARNYQQNTACVQGAWLVEGAEDGGWRHYLRGEPVHCGAGVYLLTFNGWMAGRYERSGGTATFWFSVPGVSEQCVIRIEPDMLFAWPSEIRGGR